MDQPTAHFMERGGHEFSPSEHYREAERLLALDHGDYEQDDRAVRRAHVHAILATLAIGR